MLIKNIEQEFAEGFEKKLLNAAMRNLEDAKNPLRFNNFAYAIRELTRHVLHRLSPDACILNCSWYKNETEKENGITRKQRAYFAVQGGLSDEYVKSTLGLDADNIHLEIIGSVECKLQWGSNSDIQRDNGIILPMLYPFECHLISPLSNPELIQSKAGALTVDTNSWWDGYYDEPN